MSEEDSFPANPAQQQQQPPPRKRRRIVLSCLECRSRKLKCDRQQPCARCVQSGHPQTCTYATSSDEVALNPRHPRPRKSASAQSQPQQQRRHSASPPDQQRHHQQQQQQQQQHELEHGRHRHHYEQQSPSQYTPSTSADGNGRAPATDASGSAPTARTASPSRGSGAESAFVRNFPRPYAGDTSSDKLLSLEETLLARVTGQLDQLQRRVRELEAVNGAAPGKGGLSADTPRTRGTYFDERDFNMLMHTARPTIRQHLTPGGSGFGLGVGAAPESPAASSDTTRISEQKDRNSSIAGASGWSGHWVNRPLHSHSPATTAAESSATVVSTPTTTHGQGPMSLPLPPISTLPRPRGDFPFLQPSRGHGYARDPGKDVSPRNHDDVKNNDPKQRSRELEQVRNSTKTDPDNSRQRCRNYRSLKGHYYGPSAPSNLWKEFPGLMKFLRESVAVRPELSHLRMDLKMAKKSTGAPKRTSHDPPDLNELISLLPPEDVTRKLAKLYVRDIESIYRIVHVPTFWKDFDALAASLSGNTPTSQGQQPTSTANVSEEFVVILLLAIATVYCIPTEAQIGVPLGVKHRFEKVVQITAVCSEWLETRSYKRTGLAELQINLLLHLAKRTSEIKRKKSWIGAGALVRLAMSFGLHRDPSEMGRFSAYEGEMRRRLWATIVEMEVQVSLDRGLASSVQFSQCDCAAPSNINDEEFDADSECLPPSRPIEEFTRCSLLCVSAESVNLRVELLNSIAAVNAALNYDVTLENDEKVIQAVKQIPVWYHDDETYPQSDTGPNRQLAQAHARLQLEQYLLYIHHPFASQLEERLEHRLSRMHSIKSCFAILDHCDLDSESVTLHLLRHDVFRAGLSLCYNLVPLREGAQHPMHAELLATHLHHLERVLKVVEKRCLHLGHEVLKFCAIAAAITHVQKTAFANEEDIANKKYENQFADHVMAVAPKLIPPEFVQASVPHPPHQQQLMTPASHNVSPHQRQHDHHHNHHQHQESNIRSTSSASNYYTNGMSSGASPSLQQQQQQPHAPSTTTNTNGIFHGGGGGGGTGRGSSATPGPAAPAPLLSSSSSAFAAPSPYPPSLYNSNSNSGLFNSAGASANGEGHGHSDTPTLTLTPALAPASMTAAAATTHQPYATTAVGDQFQDMDKFFDPTDMSTWGLEDLFFF